MNRYSVPEWVQASGYALLVHRHHHNVIHSASCIVDSVGLMYCEASHEGSLF